MNRRTKAMWRSARGREKNQESEEEEGKRDKIKQRKVAGPWRVLERCAAKTKVWKREVIYEGRRI